MHERIERELATLREGGQAATLIAAPRACVLYHSVPSSGGSLGLPAETDVIVPVPGGYPASRIDLAGLPAGSPLLPRVAGGCNSQGMLELDGRRWQLASYHPYSGADGTGWNQMVHGFHTYFDHVLAWLAKLT